MSLGTPKFQGKKPRNRGNFLTTKGSMVGHLMVVCALKPISWLLNFGREIGKIPREVQTKNAPNVGAHFMAMFTIKLVLKKGQKWHLCWLWLGLMPLFYFSGLLLPCYSGSTTLVLQTQGPDSYEPNFVKRNLRNWPKSSMSWLWHSSEQWDREIDVEKPRWDRKKDGVGEQKGWKERGEESEDHLHACMWMWSENAVYKDREIEREREGRSRWRASEREREIYIYIYIYIYGAHLTWWATFSQTCYFSPKLLVKHVTFPQFYSKNTQILQPPFGWL